MGRARAQEAEAATRHAPHRQKEVLRHRELAEEERGLVGAAQAHADALVGRQRGDVLAEEAHGARGGREVAGDGVEQRGLAGAVGADQRAALARGDRERDVLDRLERAERAGDALEHEGVTRRDRRPAVLAKLGDGGHVEVGLERDAPEARGAPRSRDAPRPPRSRIYGQFGTSREPRPTLSKSALDMPSRWLTFGTTFTTLL